LAKEKLDESLKSLQKSLEIKKQREEEKLEKKLDFREAIVRSRSDYLKKKHELSVRQVRERQAKNVEGFMTLQRQIEKERRDKMSEAIRRQHLLDMKAKLHQVNVSHRQRSLDTRKHLEEKEEEFKLQLKTMS